MESPSGMILTVGDCAVTVEARMAMVAKSHDAHLSLAMFEAVLEQFWIIYSTRQILLPLSRYRVK